MYFLRYLNGFNIWLENANHLSVLYRHSSDVMTHLNLELLINLILVNRAWYLWTMNFPIYLQLLWMNPLSDCWIFSVVISALVYEISLVDFGTIPKNRQTKTHISSYLYKFWVHAMDRHLESSLVSFIVSLRKHFILPTANSLNFLGHFIWLNPFGSIILFRLSRDLYEFYTHTHTQLQNYYYYLFD